MEVRHQNILQQGGSESVKIRSSNVNIFCLEHFYTIRYNTFFHTFLFSTTYQKLVFYAGIPLNLRCSLVHWLCHPRDTKRLIIVQTVCINIKYRTVGHCDTVSVHCYLPNLKIFVYLESYSRKDRLIQSCSVKLIINLVRIEMLLASYTKNED